LEKHCKQLKQLLAKLFNIKKLNQSATSESLPRRQRLSLQLLGGLAPLDSDLLAAIFKATFSAFQAVTAAGLFRPPIHSRFLCRWQPSAMGVERG